MSSLRFIRDFEELYNKTKTPGSKVTKIDLGDIFFYYVNEAEDFYLLRSVQVILYEESGEPKQSFFRVRFDLDAWKAPSNECEVLVTEKHPVLTESIKEFMMILSVTKRCNECGNLVHDTKCDKLIEEGLIKEPLCDRCYAHMVISEFREKDVPACSICHEDCYVTKLSCGHAVHALCMRRYVHSTLECVCFDHVSEDTQCPLCRKQVTAKDVKTIIGITEDE
jgi:hypothetical protein